jgi:hypothetical protein
MVYVNAFKLENLSRHNYNIMGKQRKSEES